VTTARLVSNETKAFAPLLDTLDLTDTLVTADQMVTDDDTIELRPVMSGGSASRGAPRGEASGEMIGDGRAQPQPAAGEASGEMIGDAS